MLMPSRMQRLLFRYSCSSSASAANTASLLFNYNKLQHSSHSLFCASASAFAHADEIETENVRKLKLRKKASLLESDPKYQPNTTKPPKNIGQFANISLEELIYIDDAEHTQHRHRRHSSVLSETQTETEGTATTAAKTKEEALIYSYNQNKTLRGSGGGGGGALRRLLSLFSRNKDNKGSKHRSKHKPQQNSNYDIHQYSNDEVLKFAVASAVGITLPGVLFYTMIKVGPLMMADSTSGYAFMYFSFNSALAAFFVASYYITVRPQLHTIFAQMKNSKSHFVKQIVLNSERNTFDIQVQPCFRPTLQYFMNAFLLKRQIEYSLPLFNLNTDECCHYFKLQPTQNPQTNAADIECCLEFAVDSDNNALALNTNATDALPARSFPLPLNGILSNHNWPTFMRHLYPIPNPAGKYKPIPIDEDGFIPVANYKQLLISSLSSSSSSSAFDADEDHTYANANASVNKSHFNFVTLDIYQHGIPPYKKKNTYLFVSNARFLNNKMTKSKSKTVKLKSKSESESESVSVSDFGDEHDDDDTALDFSKSKLFVLYDKCKSKNASLVDGKAVSSEDRETNETFLRCQKCPSKKDKLSPLKSTVDWKLKYDSMEDELIENVENAFVWIKLDASIIKNPNPSAVSDDFGNIGLHRFVDFYCTNAFRLSHPIQPTQISQLYVLGELSFLQK